MKTSVALLIAASVGCWASNAAAQAPVALVEKVDGQVGVGPMDYVTAGQVINLGRNGSIVLGYLKSCVRETISGGTVIALEAESLVQGGRVERSRVGCDVRRMQIDASRAAQSAGTVFRSGPSSDGATREEPLILHGRSPLVQVDAVRSPLLIRRLDQAEAPLEVPISAKVLVADRFVDLAKAGLELQPGGRYSASLATSTVEFSIAADAPAGATPLIGRLLRLP